jgi:hypothetical protein
MSSRQLKVIIPAGLAILLLACAPAPIRNVDNALINTSNASYDLHDVTKAIQRAGIGLGWQIKEETPGHIVGTLFLRSHMAKVDITYTLDEYSINYKQSSNLDYNPENNTIHKNYNGWIQNLTNAINAQLVAL